MQGPTSTLAAPSADSDFRGEAVAEASPEQQQEVRQVRPHLHRWCSAACDEFQTFSEAEALATSTIPTNTNAITTAAQKTGRSR